MQNDYKQFILFRYSYSKTNQNSHSSQEMGILSSFAVNLETWTHMELNPNQKL